MNKKKTIIIEDEEDLSELMKSILEKTGRYEVLTAFNGMSGKKLCEETLPDLVFLDFVMPKMKGDEVLEFLKKNEHTKKIPVILMSGLGEMVYFKDKDKWRWLPNNKNLQTIEDRGDIPSTLKWRRSTEAVKAELGVAGYLAKPFSKESVLQATEEVLSSHSPASEKSNDD